MQTTLYIVYGHIYSSSSSKIVMKMIKTPDSGWWFLLGREGESGMWEGCKGASVCNVI